MFWRPICNRLIFAILLSDFVVALVIRGTGGTWNKIYTMTPLPVLIGAFKLYCARKFDDESDYFTIGPCTDAEGLVESSQKSRGKDRLASKFGHPALYKSLMTPMVHAKARHVLAQVYRGRLDQDANNGNVVPFRRLTLTSPWTPCHAHSRAKLLGLRLRIRRTFLKLCPSLDWTLRSTKTEASWGRAWWAR